jgi:hypothetical protein
MATNLAKNADKVNIAANRTYQEEKEKKKKCCIDNLRWFLMIPTAWREKRWFDGCTGSDLIPFQ